MGSLLCSQTLININPKALLMLFPYKMEVSAIFIRKVSSLNSQDASIFRFLYDSWVSSSCGAHPFTLICILLFMVWTLPQRVLTFRDVLCLCFQTYFVNLKLFTLGWNLSFFFHKHMKIHTPDFPFNFRENTLNSQGNMIRSDSSACKAICYVRLMDC